MDNASSKKTPERGFFSFTFEKRLEKDLKNSKIDFNNPLFVAVSGGVDSMVLATALTKILNNSFTVITINHNLREESVTAADSQLVIDYCKNILDVPCILKTVPRGYIKQLAKQRARGEEEAARYERYLLFTRIATETIKNRKPEIKNNSINKHSFVTICTAHQRNDFIETVLMRFLQGSGANGPQKVRIDNSIIYCKPLLDFSRQEIEQYAKENNVPFREDSSNADVTYLRNRLRHKVIPFLNQVYSGWDRAVVRGDQKQREMSDVVKANAEMLSWKCDKNKVVADFKSFKNVMPAVQIQMLYNGLDTLNTKKRVAYSQLHLAAANARSTTEQDCLDEKIFANANGIEIGYKNNLIYIKNTTNIITESGFFVIIHNCGVYDIFEGVLDVQKTKKITISDEKETDWVEIHSLPFSVKSIKQKNTSAKMTIEDIESDKSKSKETVIVRYIRTDIDE